MLYHWFWILRSLKLFYPSSDIFFITVKFLLLGIGIEDSEILCSITSGSCCPLPIAIIGRKLIVKQFHRKIFLTPAPVSEQMFTQETRCYHSYPVVHISCFIKLSYTGIYQRITCHSITPSFKFYFVIHPFDVIIFCSEICCDDMREIEKDLHKKFPPDPVSYTPL